VRDPDWLTRAQALKGWAFVAVTAALLAGVYPALRLGRLQSAEALRAE